MLRPGDLDEQSPRGGLRVRARSERAEACCAESTSTPPFSDTSLSPGLSEESLSEELPSSSFSSAFSLESLRRADKAWDCLRARRSAEVTRAAAVFLRAAERARSDRDLPTEARRRLPGTEPLACFIDIIALIA